MSEEVTEVRGLGSTSPWPVLVAVGLALSEVGVFLGVVAVAVGGLLLFGVAVAGVLAETGYVASVWRSLRRLGALLAVAGAALWLWRVPEATVAALLAAPDVDGFALRGAAVVVAGALLAAAGAVGPTWFGTGRAGE